MSCEPPRRIDDRFAASVILTLVLAASLLLKLNHLDHPAIKALDESFHAVVAKNLIRHPLTPMLYQQTWLPYDYKDWQNNHIWLHKPIVPLWQMAASMAVFGVNTLALRLPSALLSTAAVWLTYAIGVELLGRRAALVAATLQAFNPGLISLVQGYVFSDHVDVAFLFWVELSAWLLVCAIFHPRSTRTLIAAGIAQGVAFHCKTYPAFVLTIIALVAWALQPSFTRKHLLIFLIATFAAAAPWTLWCAIEFPREFYFEQLNVFHHLSRDVEGWAAPWDRLIFDFSLRIYHVFYPAVLVSAIVLASRAWRQRDLKLILLYAWGMGVLVPMTFATSKTPTATLIGWPPFLLLLGALIARAIEGEPLALGAFVGSMLIGVVFRGTIPQVGWGYPNPPRFAEIMRENIWVLWHVLFAVGVAVCLAAVFRRKRIAHPLHLALMIVGGLCLGYLFGRMTWIGYRITALDRQRPSFAQLGAAVNQNLPPNTVLLLENQSKCEHIIAMFSVDRSVYPSSIESAPQTAKSNISAGGFPLFVTSKKLPFPPVFDRPLDGFYIYAIGETSPVR